MKLEKKVRQIILRLWQRLSMNIKANNRCEGVRLISLPAVWVILCNHMWTSWCVRI